MVDVDEWPEIFDTEVFEAADRVDVVSDDLWAAHAPHVAWFSLVHVACLLKLAQSDHHANLLRVRTKSAFGLDGLDQVLNIKNLSKSIIDFFCDCARLATTS